MMYLDAFVHSPFWHSPQVWHALFITTSAGVVSAVVGVFIVLRGQSFAGHILTDVGATGASASFLFSINSWYGFLSFGLLAGAGMEALGKRTRGRDTATGLVLSFFMGLGSAVSVSRYAGQQHRGRYHVGPVRLRVHCGSEHDPLAHRHVGGNSARGRRHLSAIADLLH
ncbi:MAG: metal ABC transporter permease [Alicyclobacillus shizuokensis]|nr:metal ABC transporter permease [Alicyclobacillus shizuokensis]